MWGMGGKTGNPINSSSIIAARSSFSFFNLCGRNNQGINITAQQWIGFYNEILQSADTGCYNQFYKSSTDRYMMKAITKTYKLEMLISLMFNYFQIELLNQTYRSNYTSNFQ